MKDKLDQNKVEKVEILILIQKMQTFIIEGNAIFQILI
jgi:hypothetical protein